MTNNTIIPYIGGCPEGAEGLIFAQRRLSQLRGVHIVRDKSRAAAVAESMRFFAPNVTVLQLPADDCLPYDRTGPSVGVAVERIQTLHKIAHVDSTQMCQLIVTIEAFCRRLPKWQDLQYGVCGVRVGSTVSDLPKKLHAAGYLRVSTVREAGEFALRGGLIDVFAANMAHPLRLDCIGKHVDRIHTFDPETQLSSPYALDHATILPVSEVLLNSNTCQRFVSQYTALYPHGMQDALCAAIALEQRRQGAEHALALFYPQLTTVLDLLPEADVTIDDGVPVLLQQHYDSLKRTHHQRLQAYTDKPVGDRPLPPELLYTNGDTLVANGMITANATPYNDYGGRIGRTFDSVRAQGNLMTHVVDTIMQHQQQGCDVIVACISEGACDRMQRLLSQSSVRNVQTAVLSLDRGFTWPKLTVITEADIFGERRAAPRRKSTGRGHQVLENIIEIDDYIVHIEHGIGRYKGLHTITAVGAPHECLLLEYANADKLYVPSENADLVSRYAAGHDQVTLDTLGGLGWQRRKSKVKERIRDMAAELIRLAAERQLRTSAAMSTTGTDYETFCAGFPYEETPDQLQAIHDVLEDLASGHPTDRLVCGDVGFGKTEVALRAAYVAASCGYQVALIVPTTLLARQHFKNFSRRFEGTGLRVTQLSRLVSAKDSKHTKTLLRDGHVDIVVGTHALLAKDLIFKNIGLLIVDEEQHFGVAHKEALKSMRADMHVLTLTATPIPRTLQSAIGGLRTLSLLTTPPPERLSVNTYVTIFDDTTIAEALQREKDRGGQSFFVVPRISDMHEVEVFLRDKMPHLRIAVVHGRMMSTTADTMMNDFYDGKYDLLLSTSIVESGIDVPSAGTIIIWRADMFGLAQLHQLRGRIGRARQRGYAYLTTPQGNILSDIARRRLEVLASTDSLGGGFQIANHDLDARGAGNLLGEEQSGHVREVGFELYRAMLDEAIDALRTQQEQQTKTTHMPDAPRLTVDAPVRIPAHYVADTHERLRLYRRLATAHRVSDVHAIADEMLDRFGAMPEDVQAFLMLSQLRVLCRKSCISHAEAGSKGVLIGFYQDLPPNPQKLITWIGQRPHNTIRVRGDKKIFVAGPNDAMDGMTSLRLLLQVIEEISHGQLPDPNQ